MHMQNFPLPRKPEFRQHPKNQFSILIQNLIMQFVRFSPLARGDILCSHFVIRHQPRIKNYWSKRNSEKHIVDQIRRDIFFSICAKAIFSSLPRLAYTPAISAAAVEFRKSCKRYAAKWAYQCFSATSRFHCRNDSKEPEKISSTCV